MAAQLTRRDIGYTIIARFEESFRGFLSLALSIFFSDYQEGVPSGVINKAKERSSKTNWDSHDDFLENIDFPDLKEIACYKNMYQDYFNTNLAIKDFQELMDELYWLRCKIAHIRGFTSLDLDKLLEISKRIATQLDNFGKDFTEFTKEIEENPEKVTIPAPVGFKTESYDSTMIRNNIPVPDYELEGGFIGRQDDIKRVKKLLEGEQVVTIAGAGGVGKTALALKVIEEFLKPKINNFDGIIWLSAKENKLSYLGIEDLEPTVKNYEQLLDTILEVMGFPSLNTESLEQKESHVKIISEMFASILLVIDNLETITDEEITNFILDIRVSHPKIKILITSRKGLGQVERRHELRELKEKDAIVLFRLIAKDKNLSNLTSLPEATIKDLVNKVSCYPLAIKWMLGKVAIGTGILEVIDSIDESTSDIAKFSFEQIYNTISEFARKILCAISCFDEPPQAGILKYVVDIDKEDFEDGVKELTLVSLVISEPFKNEQGEISIRYVLLPLTRGYVRNQLDKETILKRTIEERLRQVQVTLEEEERAKKQYRYNLSNMGAKTEEEKVAAMMAQNAFQQYQIGRYTEAYEEYKRAARIAPRFASIYRNWAVMEADEGHLVEADKLMVKASELSSEDPQIWLTWGNIKRKNDRIQDALDKYEKAYKLNSEDPVILNSLGQAKCRLGDYHRADELFRAALQKRASDSSIKHEIINLSSLAENLIRWSEILINSRNYSEAEAKLKEALSLCKEVIKLDENDVKSLDLLRLVHKELGFFYKKTNDLTKASLYFGKAIVESPKRYKEAKDTMTAGLQLGNIFYSRGNVDGAKTIALKLKDIAKRFTFDSSWHQKLEYFLQRVG